MDKWLIRDKKVPNSKQQKVTSHTVTYTDNNVFVKPIRRPARHNLVAYSHNNNNNLNSVSSTQEPIAANYNKSINCSSTRRPIANYNKPASGIESGSLQQEQRSTNYNSVVNTGNRSGRSSSLKQKQIVPNTDKNNSKCISNRNSFSSRNSNSNSNSNNSKNSNNNNYNSNSNNNSLKRTEEEELQLALDISRKEYEEEQKLLEEARRLCRPRKQKPVRIFRCIDDDETQSYLSRYIPNQAGTPTLAERKAETDKWLQTVCELTYGDMERKEEPPKESNEKLNNMHSLIGQRTPPKKRETWEVEDFIQNLMEKGYTETFNEFCGTKTTAPTPVRQDKPSSSNQHTTNPQTVSPKAKGKEKASVSSHILHEATESEVSDYTEPKIHVSIESKAHVSSEPKTSASSTSSSLSSTSSVTPRSPKLAAMPADCLPPKTTKETLDVKPSVPHLLLSAEREMLEATLKRSQRHPRISSLSTCLKKNKKKQNTKVEGKEESNAQYSDGRDWEAGYEADTDKHSGKAQGTSSTPSLTEGSSRKRRISLSPPDFFDQFRREIWKKADIRARHDMAKRKSLSDTIRRHKQERQATSSSSFGDHNYYTTSDDVLQGDIEAAGFDESIAGLSWEGIGQSRYT